MGPSLTPAMGRTNFCVCGGLRASESSRRPGAAANDCAEMRIPLIREQWSRTSDSAVMPRVGLEGRALEPWVNAHGDVRPQPDLGGEQRFDFKAAQVPPLFS
jgi:hypothetical protein